MPDRDVSTRSNPGTMRSVYLFAKQHLVTLTVGLLTLVYIWRTHLPEGVLMTPLSSRNVVRLVLVAAFFLLLVFGNRSRYRLFQVATSALVPLTAVFVLIYVAVDATGADGLAREDRLVEDFSFFFLMIGALCMGAVAVLLFRLRFRLATFLASVLSLLFFLIGMEEISWFQQVLEYDSAAFFEERSTQGETNLHNLYTHESEDMYYLGGFLLLVVAPFFRDSLQAGLAVLRLPTLGHLMPAYWLIFPFALAGAFVYPGAISRGANITIVLGSLLILAGTVVRHWEMRERWRMAHGVGTIALFVITAAFLLGFDWTAHEVRPWLGKEYQEFYLAWGIATYAISVLVGIGFSGDKPHSISPHQHHGTPASAS